MHGTAAHFALLADLLRLSRSHDQNHFSCSNFRGLLRWHTDQGRRSMGAKLGHGLEVRRFVQREKGLGASTRGG